MPESATTLELIALFPGAACPEVVPTVAGEVFTVHCVTSRIDTLLAAIFRTCGTCKSSARDERARALSAQSACVFRSADLASRSERLRAGAAWMLRMAELGAVGFALPAARKLLGRSELMGLSADVTSEVGLRKLFLQRFIVRDDLFAWTHSHGMEHFGLPDLECRTPLHLAGLAGRLIDGACEQLFSGAALCEGDLYEALAEDGQLLGRFLVRPFRVLPGHDYSPLGCWQLLPDPRVGAGNSRM